MWLLLLFTFLISSTLLLFCLPLNRKRKLHDVGYSSLKKSQMHYFIQSKNNGDIPPPFPNGWFIVAESRELPKKGSLKYVSALDENIVIYRGETGVFAVEAYCPHLGANFMVGGTIHGNNIICPFHCWSFDGITGACTFIPYAKKIPSIAKVKTWSLLERNEMIYLWYHIDNISPLYELPFIPLLSRSSFVYQGRTEYEVHCHIQDISENGSDSAHLNAIHKSSIVFGGELCSTLERIFGAFLYHDWSIEWNVDDKESHIAHIQLVTGVKVLSWCIHRTKVSVQQIGPSTVHLNFKSIFGSGVMIQYVVPIEALKQKLVHVFYTEVSWPRPLAKLLLWAESIMLERDIGIWNSKTYKKHPLYVKEDSTIRKHRLWYKQFYSENSKKIGECNAGRLDW